jgi:hypothetical protein
LTHLRLSDAAHQRIPWGMHSASAQRFRESRIILDREQQLWHCFVEVPI